MAFDINNPANVAALKTELTTDPRTYGYAALITAGNQTGLVNELNQIRDGSDGALISLKRRDISPIEILEAVDTRDFVATPTPLAVSWFESATQATLVRMVNDDGTDTRVKANFDRLINNGQGSQTRLNAIAVRPASRFEEMFGIGSTCGLSDVSTALAS